MNSPAFLPHTSCRPATLPSVVAASFCWAPLNCLSRARPIAGMAFSAVIWPCSRAFTNSVPDMPISRATSRRLSLTPSESWLSSSVDSLPFAAIWPIASDPRLIAWVMSWPDAAAASESFLVNDSACLVAMP